MQSKSSAAGFSTTRRYRAYVLALLVAVGVAGWVDRNAFAVLLEPIKAELELSDTELGLLGGVAFGLFYATVGLPVAWLADRSPRRSLIAAALALWSAMTAACGLAGGFGSLFLARVGVGIGEAGGSPPSQSLIADYYPPERRAFALGVFYLYIPLGSVIGFLSSGWLDAELGWRLAFVVVGLPGVALAALVRLTLREPPLGASEREAAAASQPPLGATLRAFLGPGCFRLLPLAGAMHGIGAFAAAVWLPAYFVRTFAVSTADAAAWMALAYGLGGCAGVLAGGWLADRLVRRTGDSRWHAWIAAAVLAAAAPCAAAVFLAQRPGIAVAALLATAVAWHMFLGPVIALLQGLAGPRRRAVAAAVYLFLVNLVSMGVGPVVVGAASDLFAPLLGAGALRYALLAVAPTTSLLAAVQFLLAARALGKPAARAALAHAVG